MNLKHPQEIPERIMDLLTKEVSGKLTDEENSELKRCLAKHPEYQQEIEKYRNLLLKVKWYHMAGRIDPGQQYQKTMKKVSQKSRTIKSRFGWTRYAAVFIIFLTLGATLYFFLRKEEQQPEEIANHLLPERNKNAVLVLSTGEQKVLDDSATTLIEDITGSAINKPGEILAYGEDAGTVEEPVIHTLLVPAGSRYQLKLSDGTQVWLNSISRLVYPVNFGKKERRVSIQGEAYFEVAEKEEWPFIIGFNQGEILVHGTSLNISTYPDDKFTEATLVSGCISLIDKAGEAYLLEPSQQARIPGTDGPVEILLVDTKYYTSWKDGVLYFHAMPFKELCKRLERWYDAEIIIESEVTANLLFSGAIENSNELEFLLKLVGQTTEIKYRMENNKVIIK
jgi:ferric-dicitrate binding protein FerR (iron transport regulator)